MRKFNEENERIKRKYSQYLREAKRMDHKTVQKAEDAILKFEASTGFKSFKLFHIEQAVAFKAKFENEISKTTGKPLAKATIAATLTALKKFFFWLAGQQGYKKRIAHSDADYFNQNAKDARVASARREIPFPSLQQCAHAFAHMPVATDMDKRNRALFAFLMIATARDGAIASLRLKHIDLVEGCVYQDARDVKTKFSKTFTTWFMPVGTEYTDCFYAWVRYLRDEKLFGPDDPLFPRPLMGLSETGGFAVQGLSRGMYASANALRLTIHDAFTNAGLPKYPPHTFRKTITKWGQGYYTAPAALKAFSQNLGHDSIATTLDSYCPVGPEEQKRLIVGYR